MMNELPKGWCTAKFDEILTKIDRKFILDDGQEYDCAGVRWYGKGAFVRERKWGVDIKRKQQWILKSGDVVYNKLFAWKNAFAVADDSLDGCIVSDKFPTYHIKPNLIDPKYLSYYFTTTEIASQAQSLSKGAAAISKLTLNPPQFWDLTIPLPPLNEQRRIVTRIEALAGRIAEAQFLRQSAAEEADKFLASAISEVAWPQNSNSRRMEDICLVVTDGEHATPPRDAFGDVPLATAKNVRDGFLDLGNTDFVSMDVAENCWKRCKPQTNDVLMVCVGATTGRATWLDNPPDMVIVRSVALLRPNPEILDSKFLEYTIKSSSCQAQIWGLVKQAAQPGIYINRMKQIEIPVPPLDEQRRIVSYLDGLSEKVNALRRLQGESQVELDALLPSVLDRAFKGEL